MQLHDPLGVRPKIFWILKIRGEQKAPESGLHTGGQITLDRGITTSFQKSKLNLEHSRRATLTQEFSQSNKQVKLFRNAQMSTKSFVPKIAPPPPPRKCQFWGFFLGQESRSPKVPRIFRIFVPNFAPNFSPNFPRISWGVFVLHFVGKRRPEKIHQKSPPFFNAKFPGKYEKNIHKMFLERRQFWGIFYWFYTSFLKKDPEKFSGELAK